MGVLRFIKAEHFRSSRIRLDSKATWTSCALRSHFTCPRMFLFIGRFATSTLASTDIDMGLKSRCDARMGGGGFLLQKFDGFFG
jgi:hypothetical protein